MAFTPEYGESAPHPTRGGGFYEDTPEPYIHNYTNSHLPPAALSRLHQGFDLHRHFFCDITGLTELTGNPDQPYETNCPTLDGLSARRGALLAKLAVRKAVHKAQLDSLQFQVQLTQAVFGSLNLSDPASFDTTPIPAQCLDLMAKAQMDIPAHSNALGLYQSLGKRLLVQERAVVETGLDILRDELHNVRLGFYEVTGQVLRVQAQSIMDEYDKPEHADILDIEDDIHPQLQAVAADPLNQAWPQPEPVPSTELGFGGMY